MPHRTSTAPTLRSDSDSVLTAMGRRERPPLKVREGQCTDDRQSVRFAYARCSAGEVDAPYFGPARNGTRLGRVSTRSIPKCQLLVQPLLKRELDVGLQRRVGVGDDIGRNLDFFGGAWGSGRLVNKTWRPDVDSGGAGHGCEGQEGGFFFLVPSRGTAGAKVGDYISSAI